MSNYASNSNQDIFALRFLREYYSSRDYSQWLKKIRSSALKIENLKTSQARSGYLLELYSAYLQLCEIFLTNTRIATTRELEVLETMFIDNSRLRDFFSKAILDPTFYPWFLKNIDFAINEKDLIKDYERKYSEHLEVLEEVIDDYLTDYDYLNAYKHGYRVRASSNKPNDGVIHFINRERQPNGSKKYDIYENTIEFKVIRVVIKSTFMTGMLDNLKSIMANEPGTKMKIYYYSFNDRNVWDRNVATSRSRQKISPPTSTH